MRTNQITKRAALLLTATGPTLLVGLILHPHAPMADSMAEVAYTQTGQADWWPAHVLLVSSYVLFALFLSTLRRLPALSSPAQRVLKLAVPLAWFCVLAMFIHLLLPLGRESVANSQRGWAFWVKDVVESVDGVWALCVVVVAWTLGRAGIVGNLLTALLGVAGGSRFRPLLVPRPPDRRRGLDAVHPDGCGRRARVRDPHGRLGGSRWIVAGVLASIPSEVKAAPGGVSTSAPTASVTCVCSKVGSSSRGRL